MHDPSAYFSPFESGYPNHPDIPLEWRNQLSFLGRSPLWQAFQAALDSPQNLDIIVVGMRDPLGWKGYYFEVVGTFETPHDPQTAPRYWFYGHPTTIGGVYTARWAETYEALDNTPLIARLRRVRYQDSPLWVEARWSPTLGLTVVMKGLEHDTRKSSIDQARKGIALLKALEVAPGGRPPGTRYLTRDEFHAAYPEAYAKAQRHRDHPRLEDVARAMNLSTPTLKRYRRRYGRPALP